MKNSVLFILLIAICGVQSIIAQTEEPNCAISAYVIDKDPNGLNIRDKPGVDGKIIGKLKYAEDDDNIVVVNIIGYENGWVKISGGETIVGEEQFNGIGWVSAKMVTTRTERPDGNSNKSVTFYAQPKSSSKKVGTIPSDTEVQIAGFDCFGLKITFKNKTGWLSSDDLCGNPVTTCP
jgi:hypothetical protein